MPDKKAGIYFSVILPCSGEFNAIRTSLLSIAKQQYKNFTVTCVITADKEREFNEAETLEALPLTFIKKIIPYGDINISRTEGIQTVDGDWVCFINPGDEWLPHHLSVFVEAIKHNPDTTALYSQNLLAGLSSIGRLRKENNRIQLNLLKPQHFPVVTQCCIQRTAFENIRFPWLKFPVMGDVFFLRIVDVNNDFTRINQLSCKCKNEINKFSFVHIDAFILMSDYLIRNIFKDKPYRRFLLYSSYYWAIIKLIKKFKLINAGIYLWHFAKQYFVVTTSFNHSRHGL